MLYTKQDIAKELVKAWADLNNKVIDEAKFQKEKRALRIKAAYWGISFDEVFRDAQVNKNKYLQEIESKLSRG